MPICKKEFLTRKKIETLESLLAQQKEVYNRLHFYNQTLSEILFL